MDLSVRNRNNKTLDEVLDTIKTQTVMTEDDSYEDVEQELSKMPFIMPSIVTDTNKYIKENVEQTKEDVDRIRTKLNEYNMITQKKLEDQYERHKGDVGISDVDDLYLKDRKNNLGLLDEHAFLGELDCKSRTEYCFATKKLSKKCFTEGDEIHDSYILPCKLRVSIKKSINKIENQDIDNYENKLTQYLEKAPKSICKSLVILGFTPDEIDIIYNSDEKLFKEHDEDDRGMYMRLLLKEYKEDINYFKNYIENIIKNLIVDLKYSEVEAVEKVLLLLKVFELDSNEAIIIDKLFVDQRRKMKMFSSDSEDDLDGGGDNDCGPGTDNEDICNRIDGCKYTDYGECLPDNYSDTDSDFESDTDSDFESDTDSDSDEEADDLVSGLLDLDVDSSYNLLKSIYSNNHDCKGAINYCSTSKQIYDDCKSVPQMRDIYIPCILETLNIKIHNSLDKTNIFDPINRNNTTHKIQKFDRSVIIKLEIERNGSVKEYIDKNLDCDNRLKAKLFGILNDSLKQIPNFHQTISQISMGFFKSMIIQITKVLADTTVKHFDRYSREIQRNSEPLLEYQLQHMEKLESEFYSKKDIHDCFIKYLIIVYKYDISDILSMSDDDYKKL